jgi:phage shock protein C
VNDVRTLTRSETDRMVGGVCGGLAKYFSVDATLVRVVFVATVVFGGAGLWAYLALWVLVPRESRVGADPREVRRDGMAEGQQFAQDTARAARDAFNRTNA